MISLTFVALRNFNYEPALHQVKQASIHMKWMCKIKYSKENQKHAEISSASECIENKAESSFSPFNSLSALVVIILSNNTQQPKYQ